VGGLSLVLPPGVLDPQLFRTGAWLALRAEVEVQQSGPLDLLDLGCGSGVVGVLAARSGARACASDIDPMACLAARRNGLSLVRQGHLLDPWPDHRFDLICINPPWFPGPGRGRPLDRALHAGPALALLTQLGPAALPHLRPGGRLWVALSHQARGAAEALGSGFVRVEEGEVEGEGLELWEGRG
jgi:release factor glutamine methyltransferase